MLLQQNAVHTTAAVTVNVLSLSSSSLEFRGKASVSAWPWNWKHYYTSKRLEQPSHRHRATSHSVWDLNNAALRTAVAILFHTDMWGLWHLVAFVEECTVMPQLIILQFRSSLYGTPDQSTFSSLSRIGLPLEWSDKNLHKRFAAPNGLCVRFAGCCSILQTGHITLVHTISSSLN